FSGGVTNTGTIGPGGFSVISGAFISGGELLDTGTIAGGIRVDSSSRIVASGGNNAIAVENTQTFGGGITNAGTISGHRAISISNVAIFGGTKAGGGITNRGVISALETAVLVQGVTSFSGGINNSGTISTGPDITGIEVTEVKVASGGITNSGTIRAGTGIALYVVSTFAGNITNAKSGTISAGSHAGIQVGFISVGQ